MVWTKNIAASLVFHGLLLLFFACVYREHYTSYSENVVILDMSFSTIPTVENRDAKRKLIVKKNISFESSRPVPNSLISSELIGEKVFQENRPAPLYPELARKKGWQGRVLLYVETNESGVPNKIEINESSGHKILDEAALVTVRRWQLQPRLKGLVPIAFQLR